MREWLADKEIMLGTIVILVVAVAYSIAPIFV